MSISEVLMLRRNKVHKRDKKNCFTLNPCSVHPMKNPARFSPAGKKLETGVYGAKVRSWFSHSAFIWAENMNVMINWWLIGWLIHYKTLDIDTLSMPQRNTLIFNTRSYVINKKPIQDPHRSLEKHVLTINELELSYHCISKNIS